MNRFMQITSEHYDAAGGSVEIAADGRALDLCSRGSERIRFSWRFATDVSHLSSGGGASVSLQAGIASLSPPCNGAIAAVSSITLAGSGGTWPFDPQPRNGIDVDRFFCRGTCYVFANQGPSTQKPNILVAGYPIKADAPSSFFALQISMRGGGGDLWYVYFYHTGSGPGPGVPSGGGFTTEGNIDRRGGDYRNLEVPNGDPSVCAAQCASESRCLAYTFVRAWQGNPARCWLKSSIPPATPSDCCISGIRTQAQPQGNGDLTTEDGTDRRGSDYSVSDVGPNPGQCRALCAADGRCMAYTYVRPGVQTPSARCWLKSSVPPPTPDKCCVSGVRQ